MKQTRQQQHAGGVAFLRRRREGLAGTPCQGSRTTATTTGTRRTPSFSLATATTRPTNHVRNIMSIDVSLCFGVTDNGQLAIGNWHKWVPILPCPHSPHPQRLLQTIGGREKKSWLTRGLGTQRRHARQVQRLHARAFNDASNAPFMCKCQRRDGDDVWAQADLGTFCFLSCSFLVTLNLKTMLFSSRITTPTYVVASGGVAISLFLSRVSLFFIIGCQCISTDCSLLQAALLAVLKVSPTA